MNISGANMSKMVSVPLTLEQIAYSLSQLSKIDLEIVEELLDKKFQKIILSRGEEVKNHYKKGRTISLKDLRQEFVE